jgi:hypothetical protein
MPTDLLGEFFYLARFGVSAWLFTIAGVIMVISRPAWPGSWWLLGGSIVSSALVGMRLIGFGADGELWSALAAEAIETLGFVVTGCGVLLVSMKARSREAFSPGPPTNRAT